MIQSWRCVWGDCGKMLVFHLKWDRVTPDDWKTWEPQRKNIIWLHNRKKTFITLVCWTSTETRMNQVLSDISGQKVNKELRKKI